MPRPRKQRHCHCDTASTYFKPRGIPMYKLEEEMLEKDEMEAIKLADLDGLSHEEAAQSMKISRQTFGRIVKTARNKVAKALVYGRALRIDE